MAKNTRGIYDVFEEEADPAAAPGSSLFSFPDKPLGKIVAAYYEALGYTEENLAAASEAQCIKVNASVISIAAAVLIAPEETLAHMDVDLASGSENRTHFLDRYLDTSENEIAREIADFTGADYEQLLDKDRRTPEQQAQFDERRELRNRHNEEFFLQSNYATAVRYLNEIKAVACTDDELSPRLMTISTLKRLTVQYYFAMHREIDPFEPQGLTTETAIKLANLFYTIDGFMARCIHAPEYSGKTAIEIFWEYIEREHPNAEAEAEQPSEVIDVKSSIGTNFFIPSLEGYTNTFTTSTRSAGFYRRGADGKKQLATDVDQRVLYFLHNAVLIDFENGNRTGIGALDFKKVSGELGLELNRYSDTGSGAISRSEARNNYVHKFIATLDNLWGTIPNDPTEYRLFSSLAYNPETETLYYSCPYFLADIVSVKAAKIRNGNKKMPLSSKYHSHMLAEAAHERNQFAVELAEHISNGLSRRGTTPDAKLRQNKGKSIQDKNIVTYKITCAGLIKECAKTREELKNKPNAREKTKFLKDTFAALYNRALKRSTDLYDYYIDFTVSNVIPTSTTLDSEIIVTHYGKNPDYRNPVLPLKNNPDPALEDDEETL